MFLWRLNFLTKAYLAKAVCTGQPKILLRLTFSDFNHFYCPFPRSRSPRTSVSEVSDGLTTRPVRSGQTSSLAIRVSLANDSVFN